MPAGSELRLPHTFRPFGVRMAVYVFGALLVLVTAVVWFTFPGEIRDKFTTFQRGTVIVLGLAFLAIGWGLARCRIEARREGLKVVNGYRARRFEWSEVVAVTMKPGSPWAVLDLSDGTAAVALGIQASDGARARRQVLELRKMVEVLTRTERDD
ncbi:MAG TPA: PH domain-containing protein [Nocardioides sp.]|uniref:PH domain-containing protein n=1 Tax=Nocardioides sp. TaxID=35761 RepID=UPI002D808919|nr:PH domain-containing protein [Nocardioides sp.]HET6652672.1 PH domain-containing protein [Nocardioides sp.]